jgi:hypothetical protein
MISLDKLNLSKCGKNRKLLLFKILSKQDFNQSLKLNKNNFKLNL